MFAKHPVVLCSETRKAMSFLPFKQFQFCSICRCSHVNEDKHIYTRGHRNRLMSLLQRFSSKIDTCKNVIEHPVIKSLLQSQYHQKKFWCYFCELEFSQHVISESWLILEQGFLDHLTSMAHEKNTRTFFRKNYLKDFNKFLLSRIDFNRHLRNTEIALEAYKDELQQKMLKEMKKISKNERKRKMISQFIQDNQSPPENNKYSISKCETKTKGKKTMAVFSPGLTCINFKDAIDHGTGNIFTNALPPWLQNVKPLKNNKIGPTFGDFENYLKNQRRQKLPQERVGANLDEKFPQSDFWLPSFGQVWNNNCRLQSKQDFLKHMKRTPAVTWSTEGLGPAKPYKRKRPSNK